MGWQICGQSYKASTIVIYDSRVVNYERKLFIRLATVIRGQNDLVGVGALDRSFKILILQCKFYATLFFKHFERLNFFSIQSKCLKNSKALNLCCKIIIGLVKWLWEETIIQGATFGWLKSTFRHCFEKFFCRYKNQLHKSFVSNLDSVSC